MASIQKHNIIKIRLPKDMKIATKKEEYDIEEVMKAYKKYKVMKHIKALSKKSQSKNIPKNYKHLKFERLE